MEEKKLKKVITFFALLGLGVSLSACGTQNANQESSAKSQSSSQVSSNAAASQQSRGSASSSMTSHHDDALWNKQKDAQLEAFMKQWGPTMNQSYEKYDGQNDLKVSVGGYYPTDLKRELVNDQPGLIGWAPTGKGNYEYNVVAIYNHDGTEPPLPNRITYFFAFHNGKPVVLVDQSRDGDPRCQPTKNADVQRNFERIAEENE